MLTIGRVARTLLKFYEKYEWTQQESARDKRGTPVIPSDPDACQFCLSGALCKMTFHIQGDYNGIQRRNAFYTTWCLLRSALGGSFVDFNDFNSREVVFAKLRELARLP